MVRVEGEWNVGSIFCPEEKKPACVALCGVTKRIAGLKETVSAPVGLGDQTASLSESVGIVS